MQLLLGVVNGMWQVISPTPAVIKKRMSEALWVATNLLLLNTLIVALGDPFEVSGTTKTVHGNHLWFLLP